MMLIELYVWAMVITTIACVRPREVHDIAEWACASLAGAIWPVTVAIRVRRAVRRQRQRGLLLQAIADVEVRRG